MPSTVLAFHAHPDDEALLTGGTLARAAAQGHRVVVVTATDGSLGLTSRRYAAGSLGAVRLAELAESARILGALRCEWLGYSDSGIGPQVPIDPDGLVRFVRVPVEEAAARLAAILREESVEVLLSYDVNGGYGHPDHRRVHEVGALAARLAGTPRVLETAVPPRLARIMHAPGFTPAPVSRPTHDIDVRPWLGVKREAVRAHRSQLDSDGLLPRNNALLTRLPVALLAPLGRHERYVDPAASSGSPVRDDIWAR
jgi:LmbE family N-acetylglucosaminyl deacetylase